MPMDSWLSTGVVVVGVVVEVPMGSLGVITSLSASMSADPPYQPAYQEVKLRG